jgi:multicomponent K+:H+ antiporter subunit A
MEQYVLALLIALPLFGAGIPYTGISSRISGYVSAGIFTMQTCILYGFFGVVASGGIAEASWKFLPALGVDIALRMDGLAWIFACIIAGIGVLVMVYASAYFKDEKRYAYVYLYLLLFNSAMMGTVLSDNAITLVVFWELTSAVSFFLIAYRSEREQAVAGAFRAFMITAFGGICMFAGILLLMHASGASAISAMDPRRITGFSADVAAVLVLIGIASKSAQFPLHGWLPGAMEAPTPVSCYLHAATMVKAGIYLAIRFGPIFAHVGLWNPALIGMGAVTMVLGGWWALHNKDMKGLLAYSTVSQLGMIIFMIGMQAYGAAYVHTLNHALFKAVLFFAAGAVEHSVGTRDMRMFGGLLRSMPITACFAFVAVLSMAGFPIPGIGGFLSKELFYETALTGSTVVLIAAFCSGLLTLLYSCMFFYRIFLSPKHAGAGEHAHEASVGLLVPMGVVTVAILITGWYPNSTLGLLANTALHAERAIHMHAMPALSWPLYLSALTVAIGGLALYKTPMKRWDTLGNFFSHSSADWFDAAVQRFYQKAAVLRSFYMTGSLPGYIACMFAVFTAAILIPVALYMPEAVARFPWRQQGNEIIDNFSVALVVALGALGACWAARAYTRLTLVLSVGITGTSVVLLWLLFSAPDLALTAIPVEIATLFVLLLIVGFLPRIERDNYSKRVECGRIALSVVGGFAIAAVAFIARAVQLYPSAVASYYLENSELLAGGRNMVNIIVVDFRGFDTLGEITVFSLIAMSMVAGMYTWRRAHVRHKDSLHTDRYTPHVSPIVKSAALPLSLFMCMVVGVLFFQGHNAPGGGFIAGMFALIARLLAMIALEGAEWQKELTKSGNPLRLVSFGLFLALVTGFVPLFFGHAFLTSAHGHFGAIPWASPMVFDAGVFCVVYGTGLLIIHYLLWEEE